MRKRLIVGLITAAFVLATAQPSWAVDHETEPFERLFNKIGCLVAALEGDPSLVLASTKTCIKG